jgi:hypothetical protein
MSLNPEPIDHRYHKETVLGAFGFSHRQPMGVVDVAGITVGIMSEGRIYRHFLVDGLANCLWLVAGFVCLAGIITGFVPRY